MPRKFAIIVALLASIVLGASSCETDATTARRNLDTAAEQFEIPRRIVFINGFTDNYLLEVVGFCSYTPESTQVVVICREPDGLLTKHSLVRSDNVTAVIEQLQGVEADTFRSRIIFKPEAILPDFDIETRAEQDAEAERQQGGDR